jgi:hypothetical protein
MLENNKDPADYIAAVQRLETARKTLQPMRGTGGVIGQLEQELAEIGKQWADASAEAQAQEKYSGTLSDLQHKLAEARADRAECVSALADAHRTAGSREELCRQLAEAEACFPEGAPLESELIAAENALHNIERRPE